MGIRLKVGHTSGFQGTAHSLGSWVTLPMLLFSRLTRQLTLLNLAYPAQAFGTQFLDEKGSQQLVHQSSWGVSTRMIGGIIMTHGDDKGLRLPPRIAPVQVCWGLSVSWVWVKRVGL